ncbi:succinate dehydrogenase / fumarate reductase, membrane anchor subunit [Novimethylophilus kurashikiensis]|uniref:Succinate dehydrogenase hydrophobic membrane anchor subunit n=1 Tax=Novimethylophilus kurashikiensis TaxID=1825523 RepID=A0A2R5FCG3_9PROT|nr:succinate dehydrogenase, hydrophobic membrane anchor protein [Novimethylophilus kurashikiensis]GBG14623.1 succinate dehydrogenase / fumarate reductase, membrane anchor subunit [Novimethylophilus kurashikiensis]
MVKSHALRLWLAQRITGALMAIYALMVGSVLYVQHPTEYGTWKALFSTGWMRAATLVFVLSLVWHAWLGMHDILIDYVKPALAHRILKNLVVLSLAVYAVWSMRILWSI